jgi:hypothetical protein
VYAAENRDMLTRRGFEPTEGNIYLAHFAGPGGASALLGADPSASAGAILGEKVVKANPFLKNMTVADIKDWAAKKMSGKPSGNAVAGKASAKPGESTMALAEVAGGTGSNTAGIASLPDGKTDTLMPELATLGKALVGSKNEAPRLEAPGITSGSAELAAGTRTISPEDQLAQYAALRRGYMANGGPVRMQDGPPNGDAVRGLPSWATEPLIPDDFSIFGLKVFPEDFLEAPDFTKVPTFENPSGLPALEEDAAAPAPAVPVETPAPSPRGQEERFRPAPPPPSPMDAYITYLRDRDNKLAAMYDEQVRQEEERRAQATGFPAFLRQLGLGMLSNNRSMGESLQAGLAGAIGSREEQDAEARDRIRALQLKKQMGGIEVSGDIAKLKYDSAVAAANRAAELATEGRMTPKDYAQFAREIEGKLVEAIAEGATEADLAPIKEQVAEYKRLAGMTSGGTIGGTADLNYDPIRKGAFPSQ